MQKRGRFHLWALGGALAALCSLTAVSDADSAPSAVQGAWLGITVRVASGILRDGPHSWTDGAQVIRVEPGSPAESAGRT